MRVRSRLPAADLPRMDLVFAGVILVSLVIGFGFRLAALALD